MTNIIADRAELAGSLYRALAAGDADAVGALLDPAFVGVAAAGMPLGLGGSYAGPEAMIRDFWWRIGAAFRVTAEPESFDTLSDDRLQVVGTYRGTCRRTGRTLEASFIHILTFNGWRISHLRQLTDTVAWSTALDGAERAGYPAYPGPSISDLVTIDYQVHNGVAQVILNRPEQRNAIDLQMGEETLTVARAIAADPSVRAVLFAGNGRALTVGGDIDYFTSASPGAFGTLAGRMTEPFHEAFRILERIDAPIVTAAHGSVAGGGLGFVYAADIVVAAKGTIFSTAFSGIGLSGDGGGTWHLPRIIGESRARRMYLENLRIDADTAEKWGLVSEVVPAETLRDHCLAKATKLAGGPTKAFGRQRQLLRETWQHSLSEQLRAESEGVRDTGNTYDAQHAIGAFLSKTRPIFEGR
ncbi:enoyl-CoA hydratase-related protein [Gordonia polyisoprenivorans]|uniref:enoyl-CoA hydratase-related protein n=1 Tax=Gordonia polyisoprenivorans TaxID=84595 RepID=UPI001AD61A34|nr:enoyl-CoA hydratase-related protein [Gordonia polyisoprenivorans]QTI69039.1 enoyl-CoA hydratase/isomerase family protein [Gordonia polyisoprenivorans]